MRILWLKTELLHPLDKGGKIRTYHMLNRLKRDHEVTYLSFARAEDPREAFEQSAEYCHRLVTIPWQEPQKFNARFYCDLTLNLFSPLPYAIRKYRSSSMRSAIEREMRDRDYDVAVCDFLVTSVNLPSISRCAPVLFQHNVESMIWQRHSETQKSGLRRAFFKTEWRKMLAYERAACRRFDAVVAVSDVDRAHMREHFGLNNVYDVPTGVDTDYFRPLATTPNPFELVFTGSMDWLPNQDAILYFASEIMPLIERAVPEFTLKVVGRNPGSALLRFGETNPRIKITGRVDDVRTHVGPAAAYVVPMRIGGGTRLKIYEAMAMGKPVISTSVGAEGLPVRDGQDLLIADTPAEFARAVIRVLTDTQLADSLGERARAVVCESFGWEHAALQFAQVCERVAEQRMQLRAA